MTEKCLSKRLPAQAFLLKNEDLKLKKESCQSAFPFSFFVMLCKGSCAVFNAVNHLVQIVDVIFGIKRIGGNFKGNTAFPANLFQKYRNSGRHRQSHIVQHLFCHLFNRSDRYLHYLRERVNRYSRYYVLMLLTSYLISYILKAFFWILFFRKCPVHFRLNALLSGG